MSDIVTRLREGRTDTHLEAADEIERLRAALREVVEAYERSQDFLLPDAYIIERAKEVLGENE